MQEDLQSLLAEIRKFEKLYPDKARMVDGLTGFYNERYLHNRLADEVISLPMHAYLDAPTQDRVIAAVRAALKS